MEANADRNDQMLRNWSAAALAISEANLDRLRIETDAMRVPKEPRLSSRDPDSPAPVDMIDQVFTAVEERAGRGTEG